MKSRFGFPSAVALLCMLCFTVLCSIPERVDVVVVGAGPAGLAAGYFLKTKKASFVILEKGLLDSFRDAQLVADRAGGRVSSGDWNGMPYGRGTEYIGAPSGSLKTIVDGLSIPLAEIPSPMDARYDQSQFWYGAEGLMHNTKLKGVSLSQMQAFVSDVQRDGPKLYEKDYSAIRDLDEITMLQYMQNRGVSSVLDAMQDLQNVSSKGLFGATINELSAICYLPEQAFEYEGVEMSDLADSWPTLANDQAATFDESSESFTGQNGVITDITDALASHLSGELYLEHEVTSITLESAQDESVYVVTYQDDMSATQSVEAWSVILATDGPTAATLSENVITDSAARSILDKTVCAQYMTVSLFSSNGTLFEPPAFDFAAPDGYFFSDIYDLSWTYRKIIRGESLPGLSSALGVYISPETYADTSLIQLSDGDILDLTYVDLEKIYPNIRMNVTDYDINRFECGYPVFLPGRYAEIFELRDIIKSKYSSFQIVGDHMYHPTMEAAVETAAEAVSALVGGNLALYIGLGVGIPVAILCVILVVGIPIVVVCCFLRKKPVAVQPVAAISEPDELQEVKKDSSSESSSSSSG